MKNILTILLLIISQSAIANPEVYELHKIDFLMCKADAQFMMDVAVMRDEDTPREWTEDAFIEQAMEWNENNPNQLITTANLTETILMIAIVYSRKNLNPEQLYNATLTSCVKLMHR